MKALLFIIAIILFGFVSYISFLNRGHEKIVEIFLNTDFESAHFHVIYDNNKMSVNEMAENFLQFVGDI